MSTAQKRPELENVVKEKLKIMKLAHATLTKNTGTYKRAQQYKDYQQAKKEYEQAKLEYDNLEGIIENPTK